SSSTEPLTYGMLVVLGYNGAPPQGNQERRKSSYLLQKKSLASGVKPFKQHLASSQTGMQVVHSNQAHSVSYTLARGPSVVVEYCRDNKTDMFQIGRSSDSKIDFVVMDTVPGVKDGAVQPNPQKSTISRYACRITVDRHPPYTARVFAAGFDKSNNIFLGEKAPKWKNEDDMMDGLTTNGVLLMNPRGGPNCPPGIWREISVCGHVYGLRDTRSAPEKGKTVQNESNVLFDGSLIDLCGAVLMWRSADAIPTMPTEGMIDAMRRRLNMMRLQCPVGLNTLVFSGASQVISLRASRQPHVYIKCGHVHGLHGWHGPDSSTDVTESRTCPICLQVYNYVPLQIGKERAFFVGEIVSSHAFVPCGHVCSEETVRFWSKIPIPHGCDAFQAICPFCSLPLEGEDGFVKLIFSTEQ
ncbi:predicted protein, partial [Nematostella vectensis]